MVYNKDIEDLQCISATDASSGSPAVISLSNEGAAPAKAPARDKTIIKVIGVGGGGSNAVNQLARSGIVGVDLIVCNTDKQALDDSLAPTKIQLGKRLTDGLGAGNDPKVGEDAATEQKDDIKQFIEGSDMIFITAGMGGGTGTGGAPVIAKIAKEMGKLTIAVVTTPFEGEGPRRMENALLGIEKLRENVDALIVVPNQKLLELAPVEKTVSMMEGFRIADGVLRDAILGIANLITIPAEINLDFADINTIMRGKGEAFIGIGEGKGENMAVDAIANALCNKILENTDITGGKLNHEGYKSVAKQLADTFGFEKVLLFMLVFFDAVHQEESRGVDYGHE